MTKVTTDIDIDFPDRDRALSNLVHVAASMVQRGQSVRHPTGVYFQNVPTDPITGLSSFNYEQAADNGYFKVDFLNNTIYADVRDEEHLIELMADPDWDLFEIEEVVGMLAHIHNSFGMVRQIKPRNVNDLAVVLALMRPGKRHLMGRTREEIDAEIWTASVDEFVFKRAHAIAYAVSIVVQLNLICEKTATEIDNAAEVEEMFR
jgi:hypothetical protein